MLGIALTYWMEVAIWVVLGALAVDFLIGLFQKLSRGSFSSEAVLRYLRDIVYYVFPLLLLAGISAADTTGWVVLAGFYVGAAGVVLKYLMDIRAKF